MRRPRLAQDAHRHRGDLGPDSVPRQDADAVRPRHASPSLPAGMGISKPAISVRICEQRSTVSLDDVVAALAGRRVAGRRSRPLVVMSWVLQANITGPEHLHVLVLLGLLEVRVAALALEPVHLHELGRERQHHRRLPLAGVRAPARLLLADLRVGEARTEHREVEHHQPGGLAHVAREVVEHRRIAAVAVEEHEPAEPRTRHALGQLVDDGAERCLRERHRARERRVLVAAAIGERRQHPELRRGRRAFQGERQQRLAEDQIGRDRQVRPVLLDRRDHDDHGRILLRQSRDLVGRQVRQVALRRERPVHLGGFELGRLHVRTPASGP